MFLRTYDPIFDFSPAASVGLSYGGSAFTPFAPRTFTYYRNNYQNFMATMSTDVEIITSSDTTQINNTPLDLSPGAPFYTVLQVMTITNTTTLNSIGVSTTITNTSTVSAFNFSTTSSVTITTHVPFNPIIFQFIEIVDMLKQRYCNLPYGFVAEEMCVDFPLYIVSAMPLRGIPVIVVFGLFFCTFFPLMWFFYDQIAAPRSRLRFIEIARRFSLNKKMLYYTLPQLVLFAGSGLVCAGTFGFVVTAIDNQMRPAFNGAMLSFSTVSVNFGNFTFLYANYSALTISSLDILRVGTQDTLSYLNSFSSNIDLASIIIEWVFNAGMFCVCVFGCICVYYFSFLFDWVDYLLKKFYVFIIIIILQIGFCRLTL
jgi:hypothetical protein